MMPFVIEMIAVGSATLAIFCLAMALWHGVRFEKHKGKETQ